MNYQLSTIFHHSNWSKDRKINFLAKLVLSLLLVVWLPSFFWTTTNSRAAGIEEIYSLIGERDSLLVANPEGKIIISKNESKKLVPASILKLFTSLAVFHYLGSDYRYPTDFFMDKSSNLKIKGFGDPLIISEIVDDISRLLSCLIGSSTIIKDLIVDDSYFSRPLTIPGISSSSQPYDAPNGALCVNFNTVFFKRTKTGYISAESQTPLLPYVKKKIKKKKLNSGRIVLSHIESENTIYAGQLFQYFLKRHGVRFSGTVKPGRLNPADDQLVYRYVSRFSLEQLISKLLDYSNNFTTNQLLITAGAKMSGSPGNLEKGVAAVLNYAAKVLQINDMTIVEGSGISRNNRISALHMHRVLEKFEPYHRLMRRQDREYYKTGTLHGINTRAGYITDVNNKLYRYVVMINTPGKSTKPVMQRLLHVLE